MTNNDITRVKSEIKFDKYSHNSFFARHEGYDFLGFGPTRSCAVKDFLSKLEKTDNENSIQSS